MWSHTLLYSTAGIGPSRATAVSVMRHTAVHSGCYIGVSNLLYRGKTCDAFCTGWDDAYVIMRAIDLEIVVNIDCTADSLKRFSIGTSSIAISTSVGFKFHNETIWNVARHASDRSAITGAVATQQQLQQHQHQQQHHQQQHQQQQHQQQHQNNTNNKRTNSSSNSRNSRSRWKRPQQ